MEIKKRVFAADFSNDPLNVHSRQNLSTDSDKMNLKNSATLSTNSATDNKQESIESARNESKFFHFTQLEWKWSLYILIISAIVRLLFIHHPSVVVSEEAINGSQALKYQNMEFYLDVNPPLGKLLFYLASQLAGGISFSFPFAKAGANYLPSNVPYVTMRILSAFFGALTVPTIFLLCKQIGIANNWVAFTTSMVALFDNAFATSFHLIMLDGMLMCFSLIAIFLAKQSTKEQRFSLNWTLVLAGSFMFLAFAISTKQSALFTVAFVSCFLLKDSWNVFTDKRNAIRVVAKDVAIKASLMLSILSVIYTLIFMLHISMLVAEGDKPNEMISPRFKASLRNGLPAETPEILHYGARIVLKHYQDSNYYLHSHPQVYPNGSKQQQITGYAFHDMNNIFIVRKGMASDPTLMEREIVDVFRKKVPKATQENELETNTAIEESEQYEEIEEEVTRKERYYDPPRVDEKTYLEPVKSGDVIRLEHEATGRFLHSHFIDPPSSSKDNYLEVSGYGGFRYFYGDSNDNWIIEDVDDNGKLSGKRGDPIRCQSSFVRLTHENLQCHLVSARRTLPDWALFQREITCGRNSKPRNAAWIIVANEHPLYLNNSEQLKQGSIKPKGMWEKFIEINQKMVQFQKELTPASKVPSTPFQWLFFSKASKLWNSSDAVEQETKVYDPSLKESQIVMIGNPFTWPLASYSIILFVLVSIIRLLSLERNILTNLFSKIEFLFRPEGWYIFFGWFLHWAPYLSGDKESFIEDYFVGHVFAILMLGSFLQVICSKVRHTERFFLPIVLLVAVGFYVKFSPLIYGLKMSKAQCEKLYSFNKNWCIDCEFAKESLQSTNP